VEGSEGCLFENEIPGMDAGMSRGVVMAHVPGYGGRRLWWLFCADRAGGSFAL